EAYQDAADGDTWKIRIKKVGTVTITASQPGNGEYSAAPDVEFDLTVDAKPVTISLTTAPVVKVYDGTADGSITLANLRFAAGDIVNDDALQITLGSNAISYDTKDAGTEKGITLSLSSIGIAGADVGNYRLGNTVD